MTKERREFWLHLPTSTLDSEIIWREKPDPYRVEFPVDIHVVELHEGEIVISEEDFWDAAKRALKSREGRGSVSILDVLEALFDEVK